MKPERTEVKNVTGSATIVCSCTWESGEPWEGVFYIGDPDECGFEGIVFSPNISFDCPECSCDDEWGFVDPVPENVEQMLGGK